MGHCASFLKASGGHKEDIGQPDVMGKSIIKRIEICDLICPELPRDFASVSVLIKRVLVSISWLFFRSALASTMNSADSAEAPTSEKVELLEKLTGGGWLATTRTLIKHWTP